ncbi:DUF2752 domain-containing protein [Streptacidiphilus sp. ASG 303]|uniref:DUF2752 domain-containing protein n=1 Tax=Streptacidiphilus sp. ASG 303 TaxID=2896847 RepID=UPI001E569A3E|nr:DUF2752 domain-containing protein [Streptacidiphilus sp. ASG 303]MCD0485105.1 DUF2752 domain-containing protein [Streptacidiphilus sp. ASG 303]
MSGTSAPPPGPPGGGRPRAARRPHPAAGPLGVLAAAAAGAAYLWNRDPHRPGQLLPPCPWHLVTGLLCPGCGGTRMAYDLMHGHGAAAWHDNAALLAALPAVALLYGRWLGHGLRGRRYRPRLGRTGTLAVLGAAAAWTVLRNLL